MTDSVWKKQMTTNTLPFTEGVWAKITPKASIDDGNYQLRIQTVAAFYATLSDDTKAYEGWVNENYEVTTTAQNADEVAAWCAQSPTMAFTINEKAVTTTTQVDFGGNGIVHEFVTRWECFFFCDFWESDEWCDWCDVNGYY